MSILTSKSQKRHVVVDPIFILFFSALVVLSIFALSTGNIDYLVENAVESLGGTSVRVSVNDTPLFASDQKYWDANCTRAWSSDSLCDAIAGRTQACELSAESAYCSTYKNYLRQTGNR
jgi:hypothetical protein